MVFKKRVAHFILLNLVTTPSAPQRNRSICLMAQPPLLEKEGNVPETRG
jgi:hypothetical protein